MSVVGGGWNLVTLLHGLGDCAGLGEPVLLAVDRASSAGSLHDRGVRIGPEVHSREAGVLDQLCDDALRLGVVTAEEQNGTFVASRIDASAWNPEVSVLKART